MEFTVKSLTLLLLISSSLAQFEEHGYHGYEGYQHLKHHQVENHHHEDETELDYHAHPKYSFDYSVKDPHTGDEKEHWETRDGDKVKGSYTLTETDGTKRVVEYEADDKNGFNAVVHKIGTPTHKEHNEIPVREIKKPVYEPIHHEPIHREPIHHEPIHHEPIHHEPIHHSEPINYHQDFQNFDGFEGGFVPVAGYGHGHQ